MFYQYKLNLEARKRGFHLITREVEDACADLRDCKVGLLHVFIQHSSASLTINENADPTVRTDFESHFNEMVPEGQAYYIHTYEGPDDMPAHLKSSILGSSVSVPIKDGRLLLGTWQGIYFCEHRDYGGSRQLILTLNGDFS